MVIATSIRTILEAISARLVSREVLTENLIQLVAQDQVPKFAGERDILLWPGRFYPGSQGQDGQGRFARRIVRALAVIPRVRMALDQAGSSKQWLLADNGYFALEESILDALDLWMPVSEDNEALLTEPMRIQDGDQATKNPRDPKWGQAALQFELQYLLAMTEE